MSGIEYDPSGISKSSFHAEADILYLLFFYDLYFSMCIVNAKTS